MVGKNRCSVCDCPTFRLTVYRRRDGGGLSALQCRECGALTLHEAAGVSEKDRAEIRKAIAAREGLDAA